MDERRKYKRVPAHSIIWYNVQEKGNIKQYGNDITIGQPIETVDISIGGIQIITDQKFDMDKKLKLIISVTNTDIPIPIIGRVAWIRPVEGKEIYRVGLEFTEFLNGRKNLLEKYIDQFD